MVKPKSSNLILAPEAELPEILDFSDKLRPLIFRFNDFMSFLLDGGRSAEKTQAVGRLLLFVAEQVKVRICCGREQQNSIEESVYTVLKDLILEKRLNFTVQAKEIVHNETKSEITFKGFREQGAVNIKGLEGVDILWIDEAQSITKKTLDVIIPTIRKQKSRVFFTMNRYVEHDPVFTEFSTRADCLHIHVDYRDNKHCPQKMIDEAEKCMHKNYEDYAHIWLGEPLKKSSDHLFGLDILRASMELDMDRIGIQRTIASNDPARNGDCENVFTVLQSRGPVMWEQMHLEADKHKKGDETVGRHMSLHNDFNTDAHVVDCDGLGGPIADNIDGRRFQVFEFYATKDFDNEHSAYDTRRTAGYYKLLDWIEKGYLKIMNHPVLIDQLLKIKYKTARNGKKYIMSKEEMAKVENGGVKDLGQADALMMAVWFADELMTSNFDDASPDHAAMRTNLDEGRNFRFDATNPEYAGQ